MTSGRAAVELDEMLCFALYTANRMVGQVYRGILASWGLSYTQYLVLLVLAAEGEVNVRRVGEILGLDSGTLSPLLKRLERSGVVRRQRSTDDERAVLVSLTEEGRGVGGPLAAVQQHFRDCVPLDPTEFDDLRGRLHVLADRLATLGPDRELVAVAAAGREPGASAVSGMDD